MNILSLNNEFKVVRNIEVARGNNVSELKFKISKLKCHKQFIKPIHFKTNKAKISRIFIKTKLEHSPGFDRRRNGRSLKTLP